MVFIFIFLLDWCDDLEFPLSDESNILVIESLMELGEVFFCHQQLATLLHEDQFKEVLVNASIISVKVDCLMYLHLYNAQPFSSYWAHQY